MDHFVYLLLLLLSSPLFLAPPLPMWFCCLCCPINILLPQQHHCYCNQRCSRQQLLISVIALSCLPSSSPLLMHPCCHDHSFFSSLLSSPMSYSIVAVIMSFPLPCIVLLFIVIMQLPLLLCCFASLLSMAILSPTIFMPKPTSVDLDKIRQSMTLHPYRSKTSHVVPIQKYPKRFTSGMSDGTLTTHGTASNPTKAVMT